MLEKLLKDPQLTTLLVGIAILGVGSIILRFWLLFGSRQKIRYEAVKSVLSPAERSFLGVVHSVLDKEHIILPKVRLADLITVPKGLNQSRYQSAFNRIAAKHVDFTVCRMSDYVVVGVIELDDQSHQAQRRARRDRFVDQALDSAGIPIAHIRASATYSPSALAEKLASLQSSRIDRTVCPQNSSKTASI